MEGSSPEGEVHGLALTRQYSPLTNKSADPAGPLGSGCLACGSGEFRKVGEVEREHHTVHQYDCVGCGARLTQRQQRGRSE